MAGVATVLWMFLENKNQLLLNDNLWFLDYITLLFMAVGIYMVVLKKRDELGGVITFKQAMQSGLITTFVVAVMAGLFSYIYFKYTDAGYAEQLAQHFIQMYKKNLGKGLTSIEETTLLANARAQYSAAGQLMSSTGGNMFSGLFITLIVAGMMKRKREEVFKTVNND